MPVNKTNNPPQIPPSSVSIGKKPMNYPPNQLQTNQQQQQQQPKSARAAAKAPAYNTTPQQHQHQHQHQPQQQQNRQTSPPNSNASSATKGRGAAAAIGNPATNGPTASQKGKASANKIWSTSTTEERERIKEFWLALGEQERRNLVKIEKDTVLRKMKEQQKHSCSCAVCGRKRNAIEEELEVLYDAYYEELEQYANYQQRYLNSNGTITPPPGPGPFPGSVELDKNGTVVSPVPAPASKRTPRTKQQQPRTIQQNGKKQPLQPTRPHPQHHPPGKENEFEDEVEEEEEYEAEDYEEEEDEEEDELDDEEDEDEDEDDEDAPARRREANGLEASRPVAGKRNPPSRGGGDRDGILNIRNSLTVTGPGNILTVADDLLKNDGQKFLEMMEQLAERRLQREEEAAADVEDESDDDIDEDRDGSEADDDGEDAGVSDEEDDDEEDDDDDEEEIMTEEQKMEEGKRMFSIFAARMFEQRVLQAYREKVAQERQLQLLRELDEEDKTTRDREAKKQSQNQKKKDKKRQQKMAKEEERAAKEAEKAAEEAKVKAQQAAIDEETRKKREEERLKRDAVKRAADEEKARREEEKRRRQQEEREREQEREKKKKEKEERVKKEREERERKAKEERARIAKEREEKAERDRIEREKREERGRLEKEEKLKKEKEEKAERDAKEKERVAAQRAMTIPPKTPVRLNATASSSSSSLSTSKSNPPSAVTPPALQRTPNSSGGSATVNGISSGAKKAFNHNSKPGPSSAPAAPLGPVRSHSQGSQQPPNLPRPPHGPPPSINVPPHLPQQQMMYGHPQIPQGPVMMPPNLSPRVGSFPPMQYPYGNPNMQQPAPGTPIVPPSNPQGFNAGPSFDPAVSFNRVSIPPIGVPISRGGSGGLSSSSNPPTPIGPPKPKTPLTATASAPGPSMFAPGVGRRASLAAGGLGPITRPIAPIARPNASASGDGTTSSGSGSPSRRSPSPKGLLGSSALAADDDEVVPTRRVASTAPIGIGIGSPLQSWGPASPRTALNPWVSAAPARASGAAVAPLPPPTSAESLWANTTNATPNDAWSHPQNSGAFFHTSSNQFVNPHNNAATAPPAAHTTGT